MIDKQMLRRIYAMMDQVLDLPEERRAEFLAQLNARDPLMAEELGKYLQLEGEAFDGAGMVAPLLAPEQVEVEPITQQQMDREAKSDSVELGLGRYHMLRELGRGGMGLVYLAEHEGKHYAIKLLNQHFDTNQVATRFERERQILARLDHPGIARFYESGVTSSGRAWIALEFVDGERIDKYCDARSMRIHGRIELFLQICDAVSYAHNQLVIHRDLKPGNILVTREGQVKLLDFGISTLLDENLPKLTLPGQALFTPECASPEQVLRKPVSVTADVYALGVLLYRLLTGRHPTLDPYTTFDTMARAICENAPLAPSKKVLADDQEQALEFARRRDMTPNRLSDRLVEDLDVIVLKALAIKPEQRYSSVQSFADDLRRHLQGYPVSVKPPSPPYLISKFISRHRAVAAVALISLALFLGVSVQAYTQAMRIRAERAGNHQLANLLIRMMGSDRLDGEPRKLNDVLEESATELKLNFQKSPLTALSLYSLIGSGYASLGNIPRALQVWGEGERFAVQHNIDHEDEGLALQLNMAQVEMMSGKRKSAEQRVAAIQDLRHFWTRDSQIFMRADLVQVELYWQAQQDEKAAKQLRQVLARCNDQLGPNDALTMRAKWLSNKLTPTAHF